METSRFSEKLNRLEGNTYHVEEKVGLENGMYEGELAHDNVDLATLAVYTGPKLTGGKVNSYSTSTPSSAPWKCIIRLYADAPEVYISYSTEGDTVEADDVNRLQDAVVSTQEALNAEAGRAQESEAAIKGRLDGEIERATAADGALREALAGEIKRAMDAEALLAGSTGGSGEGGSISFIEQTTVSTEDGGVNVWTMQLSDGTRRDFEVRNGTRGKDGVDGKNGADGQDGAPGPAGQDGVPGKDGAPGRDGTDGKDGAAGSDGFSPEITENSGNNEDVYKLDITTKAGKITTPNLKGAAGKDSTKTEEILGMFGGLKFGQDEEGNWGYMVPGADTVVAFGASGGKLTVASWEKVSDYNGVYPLTKKDGDDTWMCGSNGITSGTYGGVFGIYVPQEATVYISLKASGNSSRSWSYQYGLDDNVIAKSRQSTYGFSENVSLELTPGSHSYTFICNGGALELYFPPAVLK